MIPPVGAAIMTQSLQVSIMNLIFMIATCFLSSYWLAPRALMIMDQ